MNANDLVAAVDAALEYVDTHLDPWTEAELGEFSAIADSVHKSAVHRGLLHCLPQVTELAPFVDSINPALRAVQFETKLNLPGDWELAPECRQRIEREPLRSSWPLDEPPELPCYVFMTAAPQRWFDDMRALRALAEERPTPEGASDQEPGEQTAAKITEQHMAQVAMAVGDENAGKVLVIARNPDLKVDEKMRAIVRVDERYMDKTSPEWATLLGVSDAAIRQVPTWKEWHPKQRKSD